MRYVRSSLLLCLLVASAGSVGAQTQNISISEPLQALPNTSAISDHINEVTAKIDDAAGAESIMAELLDREEGLGVAPAALNNPDKQPFDDRDFYCVFHVLRWSSPAAGNNSQTVQAQNWYLYNKHELILGKPTEIPRLYGAKRITFIYIHLNKVISNSYEPLYEVEVTKRTPAYISHFLGLADVFSTTTRVGLLAAGVDCVGNCFAAHTFALRYKVSDISVTPKVTRPATGAVEEAGLAQKFDNEGKYFVDFSVGVPIRRISELKFDSTNNTVSANEVDQTNILALVNVYPRPIDIRSTKVDWVPHFVGGVAVAKQPLHKIFVGAGFGPIVANAYIGALFVKQDQLSTLNPGDPATPTQVNSDLRRRYKAQVAFGLNVPVGAIIEKLKK